MAGLGKGLAIIEAFTRDQPKLSVTDAAKISGTTRAAARRCLLTLETLGFLSHDGKHFRPTTRMLRLGTASTESASLPQLAQPHLEAARDQLNESVSLAVLQNDRSVVTARAEAQQIVMTGVRLGAQMPVYTTATGRVLLAALPDDELEAALRRFRPERHTPRTVVSRAELRKRITEARRDGMAYIDEEMELGVRSLAVRVLDARGRPVAALSVSALSARVSIDRLLNEFLPVLREHTEALGRKL